MPSRLHEALIEMFRHRPELAVDLLTEALRLPVPAYLQARVEAGEYSDVNPAEYRADAVVTLTGADSAPVLAVIVEVQLRRDPGKRWSWPVYLATLRARLRCPAVLLVVCTDAATAAWCAQPVPLGHPDLTLIPLVIGPDRVPIVTDPDVAARVPELAVLSAMAHHDHDEHPKILHAMFGALGHLDDDHATLYADLVLSALPGALRHTLEALMPIGTYEYQSDFARRYFSQGEADAILNVLDARGVVVSDEARTRITSTTDLDQLRAWIRRAATADSVDDLFA